MSTINFSKAEKDTTEKQTKACSVLPDKSTNLVQMKKKSYRKSRQKISSSTQALKR